MTISDPSGSYRAQTSVIALVGIEVLVLDADKGVHTGIEQLLSEGNLHVTCADTADAALELVRRQFFSVALVDIDTPQPSSGINTIRAIKQASPTTMVVAMTPRRSYDDAVESVRAGAIDLILKAPESVAYLQAIACSTRPVARSASARSTRCSPTCANVHEEFLQRFMETERRAIDLAGQGGGPRSGEGGPARRAPRARGRRGRRLRIRDDRGASRPASSSSTRPPAGRGSTGSAAGRSTTR